MCSSDLGDAYAQVLAGTPDGLAATLWDLQTKAADAKRFADCPQLLRRLERLYAAQTPPQVKNIRRWDVVNSLAWYLATDPATGRTGAEEAVRLADEAIALATDDEMMTSLDTAAAAAARAGDFGSAIERIDRAIKAAQDAPTRQDFSQRREAYLARRAWNEP